MSRALFWQDDRVKIVIVGGGITGLSAAHFLRKRGLDATVLEGSGRLGGNIRTERADGFVMDAGPDSWVSQKPQATALAREIGLGDRLIGTLPSAKRVYVVKDGELVPMPDGLVLGVPTRFSSMATTSLFSLGGKLRMGLEYFVPRRKEDGDESVGAFLRRRLGHECTDVIAGPLLGGIFSGDVDELSLKATFPQLIEAEQKHGSLIRSMLARKRASAAAPNPQGGNTSTFTSLVGGLGELVDALAKTLPDVRLGELVTSVEREGSRYRLHTEKGSLEADQVLFAGRTQTPGKLLAPLDAEAGERLGAVRYASAATAFFACNPSAFPRPLDGSGFIIPRTAGRRIRAGTWVSSKWEGRAPEGKLLVRVFFSGREAEDASDAELATIAQEELTSLMGFDPAGVLFSRVFRLRGASPQPTLGHLDRVDAIRARLAKALPGIHVAGQAYDGASIPDCVRQAETAAKTIAGAAPKVESSAGTSAVAP